MDKMICFPNLGLELKHVGSALHFFGFELTFGSLLIAAGMLLGLLFMVLEAKRRNEDQNAYLGMTVTALITGMIGGRLFYVILFPDLYKDAMMRVFDLTDGGMSFYGGLAGGILGAGIYCAIRKLSFMNMADTASISLVLAQAIGRWADFFNRESFGEYTDSVLAMQLPLSSVRSSDVSSLMRENLVTVHDISCIQVHPVFLYESAWCLILFLLMVVWKRRRSFSGEVFLRYLCGYGLGRILFEWLRTDKLCIPGTSIYVSLYISVALFVICGITASVRGTMSRKRAQIQKHRREVVLEAQEKFAKAQAEEINTPNSDLPKEETAAAETSETEEAVSEEVK